MPSSHARALMEMTAEEVAAFDAHITATPEYAERKSEEQLFESAMVTEVRPSSAKQEAESRPEIENSRKSDDADVPSMLPLALTLAPLILANAIDTSPSIGCDTSGAL